MENKKRVSTLGGIAIIIIVSIVVFGGVFAYQNFATQIVNNLPQIQNISQNGNQGNNQNSNQNNNGSVNPPSQPPALIVGGACSYYSINGICKIVSISKTSESIQQKFTTGYEGFDIRFSFIPDSSIIIPESAIKILASQKSPYPLRLTNSWYPGALYLSKYNINENSMFECQELVISKGVCSPLSFKFTKIDQSDYFETKN